MPICRRRETNISTTTSHAITAGGVVLCVLLSLSNDSRFGNHTAAAAAPAAADAQAYSSQVRPILQQYCLGCHSTEKQKGSLDLERFATVAQVRKDVKPWQAMVEMVESGEMPPKKKPQPSVEERARLMDWVHRFLDAEAIARAGDPGLVPMRRLSNAEYDCTIADLAGIDLHPAREFPADGAAGEGFTNAAEALSDISPTLLNKYLLSAKEISAHAVFLPDGFRFSAGKTSRDWTNESLAKLRTFYAQFTADGRLPISSYLSSTIRNRDAILSGKTTIDEVAAREKLSPKYLHVLWQTLTDEHKTWPLDGIRARWRTASEKDAGPLAAEIAAIQAQAWSFIPIGSYRFGNLVRQHPNNALIAGNQTVKLAMKPAAGQSDVTLYLRARDILGSAGAGASVIWSKPRFEAPSQPPLMLRDYPKFASRFEVNYAAVFGSTAKYLSAALASANDKTLSPDEAAKRDGLDPAFLKRWIALLSLPAAGDSKIEQETAERAVATATLLPLDEKNASTEYPAITGWRSKGSDLPVVVSNSSDKELHIPGRALAHKVVVHPTPTEFVAVAWKSPIDGRVKVNAKIVHAHPSCGNGVAWWVEHRHGDHAGVLSEGALELGGEAQTPPALVKVEKGDLLILAVDAKDGNHSCDLTEVSLAIVDMSQPGRAWDLAGDVADNIQQGNPHADKMGNDGIWSFVKGPTRAVAKGAGTVGASPVPLNSTLSHWREAAIDFSRKADAEKFAADVQALLTGPRPRQDKSPDQVLYDKLVSADGVLLTGLDLATLEPDRKQGEKFGLDPARFAVDLAGKPIDELSVAAAANSVVEVRVPAALMRDHTFVVDGSLPGQADNRVVQFEVLNTQPPAADEKWDGKGPLVATPDGTAYKQLAAGLDEFRQCFPTYICFPNIIPVDEVVCLKMYHREDEPLFRLFLDDARQREIDRLWEEHAFITHWPAAENRYLPLFIGFVTQDQSKEMLAYFESQREPFRKRAEEFEGRMEAAVPKQMAALADFAARAYRRPLRESELADMRSLYESLRAKGVSREDGLRGVLARILVAPSFLFKLEQAPAGKEAGPVNDWELATRLSYFLWSSVPDEELRKAAESGHLHEPAVLAAQTQRMIKDNKVRAMAIEFGTQWIHVRGFDEFKEKSEKLYPTFDEKLRTDIYEESILFFQDLFQQDEPVNRILDADYTYLNEPLAKHYAIPGVSGGQWRKVTGVNKFGRGGILGLASVQAKQAGAARTSPVLRGNWVVETLLGEKLPRPPPDVPKLPEEEGANDGMTMRQLVEKHTQIESCAVCHQRMDPIGFSFERYDSIGRLRDKELTGLPIDCRAKLKDGTEFEGLDGLRNYLLTKKRDVIVRLFCRRILGYALGRAVILSDQPLIDRMVAALNQHDGHVSAAVLEIVQSPQFRDIRGSAYVEEEP